MCYAIIRIELTGGNKKEETFDCDTEEKFNDKMAQIRKLQEAKTIKVFKLAEVHSKEITYASVSVEDHLAAEKAEADARHASRTGVAPVTPGVSVSETDTDVVQKILDDAGNLVVETLA